MNELQIRSILAGAFFGCWPILMNRSGLNGYVAAAVFSLGTFVIVFPFSLQNMSSLSDSGIIWLMAIGACISGSIGLLMFTGVLSKTTPKTVGTYFVLMMIVQISVPIIYHVVMNRHLTLNQAIGFMGAIIAAIFLT